MISARIIVRRDFAATRFINRRAMTLFEVFLAISIFIAALAVVTEIVHTGSRAAIQAQIQSDAVLRAETKLAEAAAGAVPLQSTSNSSFEDDQSWSWSLTVGSGPVADTLQVTVTATHVTGQGRVNGQASLARLIRDPQIYDNAAATATSTSSSSSSTSGSSR
jgi:general secretion pathway protein I